MGDQLDHGLFRSADRRRLDIAVQNYREVLLPMTLQIVALVVLAAAFVLGTARPINLGAIALAATFVIGILVAGLSSDEAVSGFPVDLMLILVGVTYLFNVGRANGTVDVSPFSGNGAAVIANATADARDRVYRTQLVYGAVVVLCAPLLLWLAIVLPSLA